MGRWNLKGWIKDFSRIIFPVTCEVCGQTLVEGERVLCMECLSAMPRLNLHLHPGNELSLKLLAGGKVVNTAAMFPYMRNNPYAVVIQRSKYNNRPDIDHDLAMEFAAEISPSGFFSGINLLMPVPMHEWKKLRRGFNQAEEIARGVSEITGIPVGDNLVATRGHATQTRRNAGERVRNAQGIYAVENPETIAGKHILLIDDIITTGSTVLACCDAIRASGPNVKISVLSLAATRLS